MSKQYIVRKVRFVPEREPGPPTVVMANGPDDAAERAKLGFIGALVKRADGVWEGHHSFDLTHMTDVKIEVIPA